MKFLIVGLGSVGQRHLSNLEALGETDIVLLRTNKGTLKNGNLERYLTESNIEAALRHKPNAVIIANPTSFHAQSAIPALRAGCHLLIEKPISDTLDDIPTLSRIKKENKSRVLVAYQWRFHPTLGVCRDLVRSGELGNVLMVRVTWGEFLPNWHPWEDYRLGYSARKDLGGGVILTLSHVFDYLRWVIGDMKVSSSQVLEAEHLELRVDSCAEISVKFACGAIGSIGLNYVQPANQHCMEIVGTEASVNWNGISGELTIDYRSARHRTKWEVPNGFERNSMFLDEMRHFISVVSNMEEPICTLDDGIEALKIALAALNKAE